MTRYFYTMGPVRITTWDERNRAIAEEMAKSDAAHEDCPAIIWQQSGRNAPEVLAIWERSHD